MSHTRCHCSHCLHTHWLVITLGEHSASSSLLVACCWIPTFIFHLFSKAMSNRKLVTNVWRGAISMGRKSRLYWKMEVRPGMRATALERRWGTTAVQECGGKITQDATRCAFKWFASHLLSKVHSSKKSKHKMPFLNSGFCYEGRNKIKPNLIIPFYLKLHFVFTFVFD